jgi:L-seryl-tRNA(Ser) seleniumtransferase
MLGCPRVARKKTGRISRDEIIGAGVSIAMSARSKSIPEDEKAQEPRHRTLPSVTAVLSTPAAAELLHRFGRIASTKAVRATVSEARDAIKAGAAVPSAETVGRDTLLRLEESDRSGLRPLFNLTGTILHTNFGRAVLAEAAVEAATVAMRSALALEFDLSTGKRGERDDHVRALLSELTGAEDATVVNNNAAAVLLCLNTLAQGREAIVSRGELIEIGGAFRMPDIMTRAGTKMVEVGTTNRTHARDYLMALGEQTGVVLKVHTSNYRIQGFTAEVSAAELASIAREKGVPLLNDLGSGTLVDLSCFGVREEPTVRQAVSDGTSLVTFSGDKLLGGPQAGFIVGERKLIEQINRNPMKRALRVDKIRLAAIEATLKLYRDPDRLAERLPTMRAFARSKADIEAQAERLRPVLANLLSSNYTVECCDCESQIGSGALPLDTIASAGLAIRAKNGGGGLERLATALRGLTRPVIGRIVDGGLTLDLRCLDDEDEFISVVIRLNADALGA